MPKHYSSSKGINTTSSKAKTFAFKGRPRASKAREDQWQATSKKLPPKSSIPTGKGSY